MKTLILISSLAIIAIASPVQNQRNKDSFIPTVKTFPENINRQKKSPAQEELIKDQNTEEIHHDVLQTEAGEFTAGGRSVGLKKPVLIQKKIGYRKFRDSNEELMEADQQENCKRQVKVNLCENEHELTPQSLKLSPTQENEDRFAPENDMENSIKLAKEAVENLQKDFVKIENSPKDNTDLKPETDLHSNIEVARKALEHIHQSFGNLEPISLRAMKIKDDNNEVKLDEEEKLNKWRMAIQAMKNKDGLFRNIDNSVVAESQHTKSFLAKDSMNIENDPHHLKPKTKEQEISSEFLNNNEFTEENQLNMEKSVSNTKENNKDETLQENEPQKVLQEFKSNPEESQHKLELETSATNKLFETEDKMKSGLPNHNDKNMLSDTEAKTSSIPLSRKMHFDEDESEIQKLKSEHINVHNDQTTDVNTADNTDFKMSSNGLNIKKNEKSTELNENSGEKKENTELITSLDTPFTKTKNKVKAHDEATLLKSAVDQTASEKNKRNNEKISLSNAGIENNEHLNNAQKFRLHEDKTDIKEFNLRMPMANDENQSTHMVLNKPTGHKSEQTSTVLKASELNFGHNGLSEQFDMMPNQDKIMETMSMNPHTLEDPTFMRFAHGRHSNQMPHFHQIQSAFHKDHLKTSPDDHVHLMSNINSLDFPGHNHHDENNLFASRLHDHMHGIPQLKSTDMDSAMAPSMYMAMRDSLGRSSMDLNGMHWNHQGRSSYGASSSAGAQSAPVGIFPNANVGNCAIPLLLSCSPNVVSGSLVKPSTPSYSAPAYRAGDDLTYFMKRDAKVNDEIPVIKVQRTTTPFNHKNEIFVDKKQI